MIARDAYSPVNMATAGERLATLEAEVREIRHDAKTLLALLEGGDGVTYERSLRGRLHYIETTLSALAFRRRYGLGQAKAWQSVLLIICAVGTAAAAWYSVLVR